MNWGTTSTLPSLLSRSRSRFSIAVFVHFLKICSWSNKNFLANGVPMRRLWRNASWACAMDRIFSTLIPSRAIAQNSGSLSQGSLVLFCTPHALKATSGRLTLIFFGASLTTGPGLNLMQRRAYRISCGIHRPLWKPILPKKWSYNRQHQTATEMGQEYDELDKGKGRR